MPLYEVLGRDVGQVSADELRALADHGELTEHSVVRVAGTVGWVSLLKMLEELNPTDPPQTEPPPEEGPESAPQETTEEAQAASRR